MKTDLARLSSAYRNGLPKDGSAGGDPCPDLERLAACAMGDIPRKQRTAILVHVAGCGRCAGALKHLLAVSDAADGFADWLARLRGKDAAPPAASAGRRGLRWPARPAAVAAAGLFVVALVSLAVVRLVDKPAMRGPAGPLVHLIAPVRTSIAAGGLRFRWESLAGAEYYRVEVFDQSFRLLWRSGPVKATELEPEARPDLKFAPGETYYWIVTAVTADRVETRSRLARFTVGG